MKASDRNIPLQSEVADCGLVAAVAAATVLGVPLSLAAVKERFGSSTRGVSVSQVVHVLRSFGFSAQPVAVTAQAVTALRTPAVVLWRGDHFVTVSRIRKRYAEYFDPTSGWNTADIAELRANVAGLAIEVGSCSEEAAASAPLRTPLNVASWLKRFDVSRLLRPVVAVAFIAHVFGLLLPLVAQRIIDSGTKLESGDAVFYGVAGFAIVGVFVGILRACAGHIAASASASLYSVLVNDVLRSTLSMPLSSIRRNSPIIMAAKVQSVQLIQTFVVELASASALSIFGGLIALALAASISPVIALTVVLALVLGLWVDSRMSTRVGRAEEKRHRASSVQHGAIVDTVRAAAAVRACAAEEPMAARISEHTSTLCRATLELETANRRRTLVQGAIETLEQAVFLTVGALSLSAGGLSVGSFVALSLYREFARAGARDVKEAMHQRRMVMIGSSRIEDIVQSGTSLASRPRLKALDPDPAGMHLRVSELEFSYSTFDAPVFSGLTFDVRPGECVAITGPSGCGKSTLAGLITGALRCDSGEITIDGCSVLDDYDNSIARQIGTVMQDDHLISGTVRDNITLFRGASDEEVFNAARLAQVHDVIMAMPMRYLTPIGDDVSNLSGGQRQRILLARALLGSPRLLVLDEATSFLDPATEHLVSMAVGQLKCTRVLFAHRSETISSADRVIELGARSDAIGSKIAA